MPGLLRRTHYAVLWQNRLHPKVIQKIKIFQHKPVRYGGHNLDHQLWKKMGRDRHSPGIGNGCNLTHFREAATHHVGHENRYAGVSEKWPKIKAGKMFFTTHNPDIQLFGHEEIMILLFLLEEC